MSIQMRNAEFRPIYAPTRELRGAAPPQSREENLSPFGQDTVSISPEAYQVAEAAVPKIHWNDVEAIQAAQRNPGQPQQYQHGAGGHSGTVTSVNGDLKWKYPHGK